MKDANEIRKIFAQAKNKEEVGTKLLSDWAKRDLKGYMALFRKDYAQKIDWDKGHEIQDDALIDLYVSKFDRKKKNVFYLLVKATNLKGKPIRFMLSTILYLKKGQAKVGVADMPLEDPIMAHEPEIEDMSEAEILEMLMQNMEIRMAAGDLPKPDDSPNCARCGRSDLQLTTTIEARTLKTEKICPVCMGNGGARNDKPKQKSVAELDEEISSYEELAVSMEEIIKKSPDFEENIDPELLKHVMTPQSSYRTIQAILADLKAQRMQAMASMDSEARLQYELKKAVEAEDFEKSAALRDRLKGTQ